MGVLRYKIFRDLWANKGRTLQVMLIIGIGAAAIGMILSTRNLVIQGMQDIWHRMNPAMINMFVYPEVDQDQVYTLEHTAGVKLIEPFNNTTIEWRLDPNDDWKQGGLTARVDYRRQTLNKLELTKGEWPAEHHMAIGQDAETAFKIPYPGKIYIRANQRVHEIEIVGAVYDQLVQPASFGGTAQFYVDQEFYEYLVGNKDYGRLMVAANFPYDEKKATELADALDDRVERMSRSSGRFITDPNKHFFQDQLDGIFLLMGVLGALALILGLLLVYNTINSIILSQVDQIGVMKAIGARTGNIVRMFFVLVIVYGVLSLLIALPITILGGWGLSSWLVASFGADPGEFSFDRQAVIIASIISLIAPLLSALVPIFFAARTTVREAISTYGLSTKAGIIDRTVARLRFLTRLTILTISNTFRHKARVLLLQLALVISGLVFIMVVGVRDSVSYTVKDVIFKILGANVTMIFERSERIDHIEKLTLEYPGIKTVESWGLANPTLRKRGEKATKDDKSALMLGVPLPTQVYGYQLRHGRWLTPEDQYAMVLNQKLAEDVGVTVGDWVTVKYGEKNERDWQVVGLIFDPVLTTSALTRREPMLRDINEPGRTQAVWIQTDQSGPEAESAIAKGLRRYYEDNGVPVSAQRGVFGVDESTAKTAATLISQFNFLLVLLGVMAVVIGAVGSIALGGALALSVLERRREIGVMRAIGASSWTIFRVFIGEGLILGWLSWLLALPIAIPASRLMVSVLGSAFQIDFSYNLTATGPILWLVIITVLSILASILPANGATKISVRESLAYQ